MCSHMGSRSELLISYVQLFGCIVKFFGLKMTRNVSKHVGFTLSTGHEGP
jgi:hypothetical protein